MHDKAMHHMKKAMDHMMKNHESPKMKKMHEAKAGRKSNKSKKHHMAESRGMKKAMHKGM